MERKEKNYFALFVSIGNAVAIVVVVDNAVVVIVGSGVACVAAEVTEKCRCRL